MKKQSRKKSDGPLHDPTRIFLHAGFPKFWKHTEPQILDGDGCAIINLKRQKKELLAAWERKPPAFLVVDAFNQTTLDEFQELVEEMPAERLVRDAFLHSSLATFSRLTEAEAEMFVDWHVALVCSRAQATGVSLDQAMIERQRRFRVRMMVGAGQPGSVEDIAAIEEMVYG